MTARDQDVGKAPTISTPGINGFGHVVVCVDGGDSIDDARNGVDGAQLWPSHLSA